LTAADGERGEVKLFRTKSDVTKTPVMDHTDRTLNFIEETDNSEISTTTVDKAIAEILHYVPDLSGYSEVELRNGLMRRGE
jgi:hypothetical protein